MYSDSYHFNRHIFPPWENFSSTINANEYLHQTNDYSRTFTLGSDGLPSKYIFNYIANGLIIDVTISTFTNSTPPLNTFQLPSECSQFTCTACYNSAVTVVTSTYLILTVVAMQILFHMM
ncbi:hypothetical protein LOD99_13382 [Oopsacas minuta]|uniref:Uncharacterized protein n=1 Tax=Oopsacas minuta TaxID=111878 RepID=A0AAV7KN49_9METZ|nr:hypothetical protein LOD99_13382 [Oopsacas minuta]